MVSARLNRPPLTSVQLAALPTAPGESREREHFLLQRMIDGDRQGAIPIHLGHLAEEIRPVIRPPLQTVVLPLMNHLVRQGIHNFLPAICACRGGLLEQGQGEANLALGWWAKTLLIQPGSWPSAADEHADGGGEAAAPHEIDRRQEIGEVAAIQLVPHLSEMLNGDRRGLACSHRRGLPQFFVDGRG